jgi:uncharacterized protein YcbK (DUF882 family)
MTKVVLVHQAFISIPTAMLTLGFSFIAHRAVLVAMLMFAAMSGLAQAASDDRALKLFFTHTGERATIVFKRNGKFDPRGLVQINRFLRDWRKNEPTKMEPRLLNLVWEVYQRSGAKEPIHVVSAYRSPSTNNMLRSRSRSTGVAKKSQHMLGKAMDFYIPGVKLATLRSLAMQMQIGGVGFYPTSGSPFVHLDVGNVRAWPRMSRQELARLFPTGRTLHLPADGRPLPGYAVAVADQKKRIRPVVIDSDRDVDDDVEQPVMAAKAPTTGSLVTALLPVPQNRADRGLALQLGRQAGENDRDAGPVAIAAHLIPIPSWRPGETTGSIGAGSAPAAPVLLATLVVGSDVGGKLVIADHSAGSATGRLATMQPVADLPTSASKDVSAGVGTMSPKALFQWALQPPGTAMRMTPPRLFGMRGPAPSRLGQTARDAPEVAEDGFDLDRFAFEG